MLWNPLHRFNFGCGSISIMDLGNSSFIPFICCSSPSSLSCYYSSSSSSSSSLSFGIGSDYPDPNSMAVSHINRTCSEITASLMAASLSLLCGLAMTSTATLTTAAATAPASSPLASSPTNRNKKHWGTMLHERKWRKSLSPPVVHAVTSAVPLLRSRTTRDSSPPNIYLEVLKTAREKFTEEISFQSKDKDISLAKALLYIAAEDEAYMAFNREMDALSCVNEQRDAVVPSDAQKWDCLETMPLAHKSISEWLHELDAISKEVEAELVSRDIGCHLVAVLEAVNVVLFQLRGFKRSTVLIDSKCSYLHSVLSSGCGSAILLSIIYIEVCRRLGLTIVGSRVGEDFLIWPQTRNPEELFKVTTGHNLFAIVNGRCVEDPRSKASDVNSSSLLGLDIATNRDIIGIALANLIRLHWKRASRTIHGLMLTSPLRPVHDANEKHSVMDGSNVHLLRPQDLRLAIMASERLLILQPHNWALRRDYGMMLYYNREYSSAVQELSICMAFAPQEEAEVLEPFVEKLHLLRLESSWESLARTGRVTVP